MACVKCRPVDLAAGAPQLAERLQQMIELARLAAFRRRRSGEQRLARCARTVLPRERLERAARPDFKQTSALSCRRRTPSEKRTG